MMTRTHSSLLVPALLAVLGAAGGHSPPHTGTLQVEVVDADSGRPLPARVSIRDSRGAWPWGRDARGHEMPLYLGTPRIWAGGRLTLQLPAGPTRVIVSRPFEYRPFETEVTVRAGETERLPVRLRKPLDLRKLGWLCGDGHDHVVHGRSRFAVDIPTVVPIARAEGLDWSSFCGQWTNRAARQPTAAQLTAICRAASTPDFIAAWGQEYPKDHLGHMATLMPPQPEFIQQWAGRTSYHASLADREAFAHFEILRALRHRGALSVYTHPTRQLQGSAGSPEHIARELPFDVVAAPDLLQGLDVMTDAPLHGTDERLWFFLLNQGFRLPLCAFTDTFYDDPVSRPGHTRTYVHVESDRPTIEDIIAGIRAGRTFGTTGPLVLASMDGRLPGAVFPADESRHTLRVRALNLVSYLAPAQRPSLGQVEVIRNGAVWKRLPVAAGQDDLTAALPVAESQTAWYVVRVRGTDPRQVALTSPIYFQDDRYRAPVAETAVVRGSVSSSATGTPLEGTVEAVEYGLDSERVVARTAIVDGGFALACPATCRIRARSPGHRDQMKSVLLDTDRIYRDILWPIRTQQLYDPATYAKIRTALHQVWFAFELVPMDGS